MFLQTSVSALCSAQTSEGVLYSAQALMSWNRFECKKVELEMFTRCSFFSLRVLLSTQSGRLQLSTQRDSVVRTLALHVHVHQVGSRSAGAAVPRTERAVAAAARRRAQGPRERAQLPGVGSHPGRGGPWPGGELQRLGSLQGADEAERIRFGDRWSGGFTPMRDWEDGGGVGKAGDVQGVLCTWIMREECKQIFHGLCSSKDVGYVVVPHNFHSHVQLVHINMKC